MTQEPMQEHSVSLMIFDISGYTRFMVSQKNSLIHAQLIISALMQSLIDEVQLPFKIAKLEGDAIFLYADTESNPGAWAEFVNTMPTRLQRFFDLFSEKLSSIFSTNLCSCDVCSNIESLRLKLVCHIGRAVVYKIGRFYELAGVDVILVHRLLKNSIDSKEYILFSQAAFNLLAQADQTGYVESEEDCEGLGKVKVFYKIMQHSSTHEHNHEHKPKQQPHSSGQKKLFPGIFNTGLLMLKTLLIRLGVKTVTPLKNISD